MKIFIGCSSSSDIPKNYLEDSKKCLETLFKNDCDLVFGACNNGIMGIAYNSALNNDREIIGICPELYKDDFLELKCTTEVLTNSISERTDKIIEEADILLFLPGGIGTIYELLTTIESKRSHEFDKPIIIYNSNNYFEKLLDFLEKIYTEKFTSSKVKSTYHVFDSSDDLIAYLKEYKKQQYVKKLEIK